jgi:hypothetical protein
VTTFRKVLAQRLFGWFVRVWPWEASDVKMLLAAIALSEQLAADARRAS